MDLASVGVFGGTEPARSTRMRTSLFVLLVGALVACGDDSGPDDGDAAVPPSWPDAPSSLELGEGERVRLVPPPGAALTVASTGVDAEARDGVVTVFAPYGSTNGEVTVALADDAGSTDVVIDVSVPPLAWDEPLEAEEVGPEAREHPALILDEARGRLIVIGGSGYRPYGTPLGDAWAIALDSGAWSELNVIGSLPALGSMRVARDGATTALLFGGYGEGGANSDQLTRVDFSGEGLVVSEVAQTGYLSAAPRSLHAFFFDPETSTYWTFGGLAGFSPRDDVRRMVMVDGTAEWAFEETGDGPSGRYGFFWGFDEERGRLWVFSGAQGTAMVDPARDLWMLDVRTTPATWTLVLEGDPLPVGRRNGVHAWDPRGPRLWVFGGTPDAMSSTPGLFALDLGPVDGGGVPTAHRLDLPREPPLRSSGAGIFDPTGARMLLGFGNSESAVYADVQSLVTR